MRMVGGERLIFSSYTILLFFYFYGQCSVIAPYAQKTAIAMKKSKPATTTYGTTTTGK